MGKNILIITSSLRAHSNSDTLAASFARGAKEAGNTVETVSLKGKNIGFCKGCMACLKTQKCAIRDDAAAIAQKVKNADVLVFATPVYYYSVSGQLKTVLDRCNPLFASAYAFRQVYLLATAAEEGKSAVEGSVKGMQGWINCFEKAELAGTVFAGGVDAAGEIAGRPVWEEAYEAGKEIR